MSVRPATSKLLSQRFGTEAARPALPPIREAILYTSKTQRLEQKKAMDIVMSKVKEPVPDPTTPARTQADLDRAKHAAAASKAFSVGTFMAAADAPPSKRQAMEEMLKKTPPKMTIDDIRKAKAVPVVASTPTAAAPAVFDFQSKIKPKTRVQVTGTVTVARTVAAAKVPECVKKYAVGSETAEVLTTSVNVTSSAASVAAAAIPAPERPLSVVQNPQWVQADVHSWSKEMRDQLEKEFPILVEETVTLSPLFDQTMEEIKTHYKGDTTVVDVLQKMYSRKTVVDADMDKLVPTGLLVKVWKDYVVKIDAEECYKLFSDNIIDMGKTCIQGDTHRLFSILVAMDRALKDIEKQKTEVVTEAAPAPIEEDRMKLDIFEIVKEEEDVTIEKKKEESFE